MSSRVTLSIAILLSLLISLTITPVMCAYLLSQRTRDAFQARWAAGSRPVRALQAGLFALAATALDQRCGRPAADRPARAQRVPVPLLPATFFPEQDTGILIGQIIADQSVSFSAMEKKLAQLQSIVKQDPAVPRSGFHRRTRAEHRQRFIELKPLAQRHLSATEVVNRLRPKLNAVSGARLFLQAQQDLHIGGRQAAAEYQYTLTSDDANALFTWAPKLVTELGKYRGKLEDVNSDLQQNGLQTYVNFSRATAARYGFQPNQIDNVLYDAFGQRTVSTIYNPLNQYFVVMEVAPAYWQYPQALNQIYLSTAARQRERHAADADVPRHGQSRERRRRSARVEHQREHELAERRCRSEPADQQHLEQQGWQFQRQRGQHRGGNHGPALRDDRRFSNSHTATQVNHQSGLVAGTISFNLPAGGSLSEAGQIIAQAERDIGMPASVHGAFAGAAQAYAQSMGAVPLLILAALVVVYIVLGVLYENTVHPLTILSTLPSAGIGATLALLIFGTPFSVIAMIGIILLIGIVKKNGIMMVDVAIQLQRHEGMNARDAIHEAAVVRLRPIMMTTAAAVLGAVPLAIGIGQGASLRQPLGVTVMGGLLVSQVFTLYTTPVIYLYLDRLRARLAKWSARLPWNRRGEAPDTSA